MTSSEFEGNVAKNQGSSEEVPDSWARAMELHAAANERLKLTGRGLCAKGVFKFKSHEEADAWMTEMLARPPEKTCS
jgi:hypothetical protein